MPADNNAVDLGRFLDEEVIPAVFERLDSVFPEFDWKRKENGWEATTWPSSFPVPVEHENPERLVVYKNRPYWIKVHGHGGVRLIDLVNGGTKPTGKEWPEAIRTLARAAGVDTSPIDAASPEQLEAAQKKDARRRALEVVTRLAQTTLQSDRGAAARDYLLERGFGDADMRQLGLGLYLDAGEAEAALRAAGVDLAVGRAAGLCGGWAEKNLQGYILLPWHDAFGYPLTIYGRWQEQTPPDGSPKTIALPGEGTKASPLYLDRAREAWGKAAREVVLVEGVFDAALLQARGDHRVVASVAAQLNGNQLETLKRLRVERVFVCGDPDGGGDRGNLANVRALLGAEIPCYVVPRLPDGQDPDEFVVEHGIDGWRALVAAAEPGEVFGARVALGTITPEAPAHERHAAALAVGKWVRDHLRRPEAKLHLAAIAALVSERTGYGAGALRDLLKADGAPKKRASSTAEKTNASTRGASPAAAAKKPNRPSASGQPPTIRITTDELKVNDQAITALADHPDIYRRGGVLVQVVTDSARPDGLKRPAGAPRIAVLPQPRLRELLADVVTWAQYDKRVKDWVPAHPPDWTVRAIDARGEWPKIRHLEGVVETPVLRADGTVLDTPGYDRSTGLLLLPLGQVAPVPANPSLDDARHAIAALADVVSEFPFATPAHRAAWIAAVLTLLSRHAFDGPAPLNLIDANVRSAGKGLLMAVTAEIGMGRPMALMAPTTEDEEMRKRITSVAIAGDPVVVIDNVVAPLGGASLDVALTTTWWKDRILGVNKEYAGPLSVTWFATGNNVVLVGDTARRCLHIRLDSPEERPEERVVERPQLLAWVRAERPRLVAAALTILRAYCAAGRPDQHLLPWGSFEAWSDLVRNAVVWAGEPDPGETRMALREVSDTDTIALAQLVTGWAEVASTYPGDRCTVAQGLARLDTSSALQAALAELVPSKDGKPEARRVGKLLQKFRKRVVQGRALDHADKCTKGGKVWRVIGVTAGGDGDNGDKVPTYAGRNAGAFQPIEGETLSPSSPSPPGMGLEDG